MWLNALGVASFVLSHFGVSPLDANETAGILAVGNLILRIVTKQPISLS